MGEGGKRKSRQEEAPPPPSYRILTSDELGLLKVSEVPDGDKWEETAAKQRWGSLDKQQAITRLQVHCPDWNPDRCLVAAARAGGRVTLHAGSDGGDVGSFRAAPPATTSGRSDVSANDLLSLRFAEEGHHLLLATATAAGHFALHRCPLETAMATAAAGRAVATWEEVVRMPTIGDLQAMDVSTSGRHVAVGGDGSQLKVWDLAAAKVALAAAAPAPGAAAGTAAPAAKPGEPLFAGKSGKASRSGLQDLAHVTAVAFVPGQGDQQIVVGTAKHKLFLYDMRAGRKPQSELVWGEGRITALLPQPDGVRVWVGNGRGQVEALDLRQAPSKIAMGHALKGMAGSIRGLALHPEEPLIASVSLDRHLRVHSTIQRSQLTKVYLKQALTGVAFLPPQSAPPAAAAEEEQEAAGGEAGVEPPPQQQVEEDEGNDRGAPRRHQGGDGEKSKKGSGKEKKSRRSGKEGKRRKDE